MADEDPIRQLQHLLDDPRHLLERISRIQSVIGSVGEPAPPEGAPATAPTPLAADSPPFENLLRMLRDMQAQIDQRIRPLALQAMHTEAERLRQLAKQEQTALDQHLEQIDRALIECVARIDESQKIHRELAALNGRLEQLGAEPEPLDHPFSSHGASGFLQRRVQELDRQGKL